MQSVRQSQLIICTAEIFRFKGMQIQLDELYFKRYARNKNLITEYHSK